MKRIALLLVAVAAVAGVVANFARPSGHADGEAAPIYGVTIPPGYRDWKLISAAHEEGNLNDLRAQLGNDVAMKAFREGKLPFPDGTIIAALHWNCVPSEEHNKVFGRAQSFVAGPAKNIQFMVKDSRKYAATGGWGSLTLRRANLPTRRCTKPAFLATSLPMVTTQSSPITHVNSGDRNLAPRQSYQA
jgi:hypothetical protein